MIATTTRRASAWFDCRDGADGIDGNQEFRWYVLHAKSRQEKMLARDLAAMQIDHYIPLRCHSRYHGSKKLTVELPLFPGYLFLRGSLDQAYAADRTRRVVQIIRVADQAHLCWELRQIKLAIEQQAPLVPHPQLRPGRKVEVTSGPFRGLQGIIEERGVASRLILAIELLGRAVSLEIDGSLLEPLEEGAGMAALRAPGFFALP